MYFITTCVIVFFISSAQGLPALVPYSVAVNISRNDHPLSGLGKIIGGVRVPEDEMLYMLSMEVIGFFGPEKPGSCGASAINPIWGITAAHCLKIRVVVAPKNVILWSNSKKKWNGIPHKVENIVLHPKYKPYPVLNDIALLKVRNSFVIGSSLAFIQLVKAEDYLKPNTELIIAGWGRTTISGRGSHHLLKTNVTYISNDRCQEAYDKYFPFTGYFLTNRNLCGLPKQNSPHKGDSGGPLVLRTGDGDILVGIVSYGIFDYEGNKLEIYTRVSEYVNWINKITSLGILLKHYKYFHGQKWLYAKKGLLNFFGAETVIGEDR